jgi:hypothetical protein
MKLSGKKIALVLVVSSIAVLWCADEYPALRFHGDARFSGGPVFGYSLKMRSIPFYQAGEYVFHFRGLPNEEMSLQLYAEGKTDSDRAELTQLETVLEALFVDSRGRTVCQATGVAREGQNEHIWVLMSGGDVAAFWHWNCVHLPLKSTESYTLTLRIRNVDPKTPRINLLPYFEGGQLDLP